MTDPIADMLTRIRNAQMVKQPETIMPYSKLKHNILELLKREGWIANVEKIEPVAPGGKNKFKQHDVINRFAALKVALKYSSNGEPMAKHLARISKPGRRVYVGKDEIPFVLNGAGLAVISTPKGLLTDKEARKAKVGGEVICEIY